MAETLLNTNLNERRLRLGMSCQNVADRSGVSLASVQRIMKGDYHKAKFETVESVAGVLGVTVTFDPVDPADAFKRRQAELKAKELVSSVQGTSALECQAVDNSTLGTAIESLLYEFLRSDRKLWAK